MDAPHSAYLHWAGTRAPVRYNLAGSGAPDVPIAAMPGLAADLEITTRHRYGYPPLLQAIAARYGAAPDNVATAPGCSMANHLAMAALVRRGARVLMEAPVYEPLLSLAQYLGAHVDFFQRRAEDGFTIDPERVVAQIHTGTRLVVLSNLHNPTGVHCADEVLNPIGRAAERVGARVLVDEVYLDMLPAQTSVFRLGPAFVVTNSLTKVYGLSGLRCGWVLAEAEVISAMRQLNDLFGIEQAHVAERMSVAAFPFLDGLRDDTLRRANTNRRALQALCAARDDVRLESAGCGTTAFPHLVSGDAAELDAVLRERYETTLVPGRHFGLDSYFRIGLAGDIGLFSEAMTRMASGLDDLKGLRRT